MKPHLQVRLVVHFFILRLRGYTPHPVMSQNHLLPEDLHLPFVWQNIYALDSRRDLKNIKNREARDSPGENRALEAEMLCSNLK